jgi:hypothetical protein
LPAPAQGGEKPPARESAVILSLAESSPVLGVHQETELRIEVTSPPPGELPFPRIMCNAGRVEDVVREGPASFSARYLLPSSRFPHVALMVVEFPALAARAALPWRAVMGVSLRAAAIPAFRTDPGAQVTLHIGDKEYGPEPAGSDGIVHIPVVVPPGIAFGLARSVNRHGRASEQMLDLKIPPGPRLLLAAPPTLAAGSVAEVRAFAVEPSGRLADGRTIVLRSSALRPHPLGSRGPGEAAFLVRAPSVLHERSLRLEALVQGEPNTAVSADVALVPAPAARLDLQPEAPVLRASPDASLRVFIAAADAFGNRLDAGRAAVLVDDSPARPLPADDRAMVLVQPPIGSGDREAVYVEAVLDAGHAITRIPLWRPPRPRPPWWAELRPPRHTLTPRLGVLWNLHREAGMSFLLEALQHRGPWPRGMAFGLAMGFVHNELVCENRTGATRVHLQGVPLLALARLHHRRNRLVVGLGLGGGLVLSHARVRSFQADVNEHDVAPALEAAVEAGLHATRSVQVVAGLRYLAVRVGRMSGGDEIVGNAGGLVGDLGYRLVW